MKKAKSWYSLRLIIPALIILPPLGLFMLWKSPRTRRAKATISIIYFLLITGTCVGAIKANLYERYFEVKIPKCGFDVSLDSRGHYRTRQILPLEYEIFGAVVREVRRQQNLPAALKDDPSYEPVRPEAAAFEEVADLYDLDYADVEAIYMKVSSRLAERR